MSDKRNAQTVNHICDGNQVNRLVSGLSKQQREILDVIAELKRDERGLYDTADISIKIVEPGDRSSSASVSRAVIRLEGRGFIERHHRHHDGKKHGCYYFVLTEVGLAIVNDIRRRRHLPALEMIHYVPKPLMTDEEFTARMEALHNDWALLTAKQEASKLSPKGLEELRQWIDERLRLTLEQRDQQVNR